MFFLSIMWWLSEEVGFSYGVASWNKSMIVKWQFVKFFKYPWLVSDIEDSLFKTE